MPFEAAREGDYPVIVPTLAEARAYVAGTPVSKDGNRPWIRDTSPPDIIDSFLMIGGRPVTRRAHSDAKVAAVISELPRDVAIAILDEHVGVRCYAALDDRDVRGSVLAAYRTGQIEGAVIVMEYFDMPEPA